MFACADAAVTRSTHCRTGTTKCGFRKGAKGRAATSAAASKHATLARWSCTAPGTPCTLFRTAAVQLPSMPCCFDLIFRVLYQFRSEQLHAAQHRSIHPMLWLARCTVACCVSKHIVQSVPEGRLGTAQAGVRTPCVARPVGAPVPRSQARARMPGILPGRVPALEQYAAAGRVQHLRQQGGA